MEINKGVYNLLFHQVGLEPHRHISSAFDFKLPTNYTPIYTKSDIEYQVSDYDESFVEDLLIEKYLATNYPIGDYPILNSKYRPVFLYVKNDRQEFWDAYESNLQTSNRNSYYHFMYCDAVKKLFDRHMPLVGTTRSDGYFYVYMTDTKQYATKPLFTCRRCIELWKRKHSNIRFPAELIDRPGFIKAIYNTLLPSDNAMFQDIKSILSPRDTKFMTYDPSWSEMSYNIKKLRHFTCERCGKTFVDQEGNYTSGLEVHHKDKNKRNNLPSNLEVLCEKCHDKQHPKRKEYFPLVNK